MAERIAEPQRTLVKANGKATADPLRQVAVWIVEGHSDVHIAEALADKFPRAKAGQLLAAAKAKLAEEGADADEDLIRGAALEGTRLVYQKCLEIGDHQTALRALKQLVELATK
jgi:hypothetical protein